MSVDVVTFGCRLNAYEVGGDPPRGGRGRARRHRRGQHLRGHRARRCARRASRSAGCGASGRDARIVVTGCAAQTEPQTFAAMPEVDRVLGNEEKLSADIWARTRDFGDRRRGREKIVVNDIMAVQRDRRCT